jgi:hypothetical protein
MTTLPNFTVSDFDELSELDFALCHGPYFYCRYRTSIRRIGA